MTKIKENDNFFYTHQKATKLKKHSDKIKRVKSPTIKYHVEVKSELNIEPKISINKTNGKNSPSKENSNKQLSMNEMDLLIKENSVISDNRSISVSKNSDNCLSPQNALQSKIPNFLRSNSEVRGIMNYFGKEDTYKHLNLNPSPSTNRSSQSIDSKKLCQESME